MKLKFDLLRRSLLFVAMLLLFSLFGQVYGQGWMLTWYLAESGLDSASNEVVHIPDYVGGHTFPLSHMTSQLNRRFHLSRVVGEENGGFSSLRHPSGTSSITSYNPVAATIQGLDTILVLSEQSDPLTGHDNLFVTSYEYLRASEPPFPTQVWHKLLYDNPEYPVHGAAIMTLDDGGFLVLGEQGVANATGQDLVLVKASQQGETQWVRAFPSDDDDEGVGLQKAIDGGYYLLKNVSRQPTESTIWLLKTDAEGNQEWEVLLSEQAIAYDMTTTAEGGLAVVGTTTEEYLLVMKLDAGGQVLWRQDYPTPGRRLIGRGVVEDQQGHILVAGRQTLDENGEEDAFLAKLTSSGTPLWERDYGRLDRADGFNDIVLTPAGDYLLGGFRQNTNNSSTYFGLLAKTDTFGIIKSGNIRGNVFQDLDLSCQYTAGENPFENWNIAVTGDSVRYYGRTDAQGNYSIPVDVEAGDTASYTVSLIPVSSYWEACVNDLSVRVSYLDTAEVDFAVQDLLACPLLEGQIANSRFRPCETAELYFSYCNNGTILADSASVAIELDPNLTFVEAGTPPSEVDGNTYTFPLGDVAAGECGELNLSVQVACDSVMLGDVLCVSAHLYPDSICTVEGQPWSGALMELSYECSDDSLRYYIRNVGDAPSELLDYVIIEDAVLLMQGDFSLPTDGVESPAALPLNGTLYHLVAQQEPGAPGAAWISLGSVGCAHENDSPLNQFPQNMGNPFIDTRCISVVGAYDPNDKQASPVGFTDEHYILPNTDLEYTIRFQNTGTDTAFRVVLLDTLSAYLDPASIVPGASSHPYEFKLYGEGILSFSFPGIALPDSITNLVGSQGFITFKVKQRPELPTGTRIENQASIYFDFNAPIVTNTIFHTVNEFIEIVSGSVVVKENKLVVKVMPNPVAYGARIILDGKDPSEVLSLKLFDLNGKLVRQLQGQGNTIWLDRAGLPAGMYVFTIENPDGWLASGKLVVQ